MSFREKSAWAMTVALAVTGMGYAAVVWLLSGAAGQLVPPLIPLLAVYTAALAVLAIASHIVLAALSPKDASAPHDERDRIVQLRASTWSSYVFATGVALALGLYLLVHDGDALFYGVFGAWILAQFAEYAFQIAFYRSAA